MTPEERADFILSDLQAEIESLRNRLASAFREAIEEEREACARECETEGRSCGHGLACHNIDADRIRSRGMESLR